jgi:hypothetical protein
MNVNKNAVLQGKGVEIDTVCRDLLGNALQGYWTAIGQCEKGIGKPLGNAHRSLDNLCAILKGY